MKWIDLGSGPVLREIGREADGTVLMRRVVDAHPGDVDLSNTRSWGCAYKGYSYLIAYDGLLKAYSASARPLDAPPFKIIGDEDGNPMQWLTDRDRGVRTFSEAERLCVNHSRGRRDA